MSRIKSYLYGTLAGIIALSIMIFAFALIYYKTDFDSSYISILTQIAYGISSFIAGFVSSKIFGRNGIVSGLITSVIMAVICLALSLLFGKHIFSLTLIITLLLILAFGVTGGVLSLNVGKNKGV